MRLRDKTVWVTGVSDPSGYHPVRTFEETMIRLEEQACLRVSGQSSSRPLE